MNTGLFLILFVRGLVGATFGPLPYDMTECERRRADLMQQIERGFADGKAREGSRLEDCSSVCTRLYRAPSFGTSRQELGL